MHHWAWKPDPFAIAALVMTISLYAGGLFRLSRRKALPPRIEMIAAISAWLVMAIALLSPIATLSEWLFSVHMTQHELLMLVAAPLLAIGRPVPPMLFALPASWRARSTAFGLVLRWATLPVIAVIVHAVALWVWHVPALYEAAVMDERLHLLQHVCFAGTAALFWWGVIRGRYGRLGYGVSVLFVFVTALHSGGLGALLAFSRTPWYPLYAQRAAGLSDPLVDQQLGGVIMWVPSGVVMMLFGLALFAAWLGEAERRRQRGWS